MSWQAPIKNQTKSISKSTSSTSVEHTRREEVIDLDEISKRENVIQIGNDRFICVECGEGWTFARMKTITCCGFLYVRS